MAQPSPWHPPTSFLSFCGAATLRPTWESPLRTDPHCPRWQGSPALMGWYRCQEPRDRWQGPKANKQQGCTSFLIFWLAARTDHKQTPSSPHPSGGTGAGKHTHEYILHCMLYLFTYFSVMKTTTSTTSGFLKTCHRKWCPTTTSTKRCPSIGFTMRLLGSTERKKHHTQKQETNKIQKHASYRSDWSNQIQSLNPRFYSAGALFLFLPATQPQNLIFFFSTEKCLCFSWIILQTFKVRFW